MKMYLAGGMTVMRRRGRERELAYRFASWRRLFSFYYLDNCIRKSQILEISREIKYEVLSGGDSTRQ